MAACQEFVRRQLRCISNAEPGHRTCAMHLKIAGWRKCPDCGQWTPPRGALQFPVPAVVTCGCTKKTEATP